MMLRPLTVLVLAAGKGVRMKSARPKVLHEIAGMSMLGHVLALSADLGAEATGVVVAPGMDIVRHEVKRWAPGAEVFLQEQQLGTADAVRAARPMLAQARGDVIVLFADTPLFKLESIRALREVLAEKADVAVLGFRSADPTGYGRLITDTNGGLVAIREHKEANDAERALTLCNSGVMAFRAERLLSLLDRIANKNASGEYYLTDAVAIARGDGLAAAVVECPEEETLGVNSRDQLATAEAIWQRRRRLQAMRDGATLIAPETVWFSYDTRIGRDVVVEPNVFFGPNVAIEDGVSILAHSHISGARIATGARIGPFARLRPGAEIGADVHVGNFVEVKAARLEEGAKANHLAYIGDGRVGAGANIGAGTIFCNYDGFNKHFTDVGRGAFVGSNSALVAPIRIGDGAYIGSGSVITKDVESDALALERAEQQTRAGWAAKYRMRMQRAKSKTPR